MITETTNDSTNGDLESRFCTAYSKLVFCKKYKPTAVPAKNKTEIKYINIFFFIKEPSDCPKFVQITYYGFGALLM